MKVLHRAFLLLAIACSSLLNVHGDVRVTVRAMNESVEDAQTSDLMTAIVSHWQEVSLIERADLTTLLEEFSTQRALGESTKTTGHLSSALFISVQTFGDNRFVLVGDATTGALFFAQKCSGSLTTCLDEVRPHLGATSSFPNRAVAVVSTDESLKREVFETITLLAGRGVPIVDRSFIDSVHRERVLGEAGITGSKPASLIGASHIVSLERSDRGVVTTLIEVDSGRNILSLLDNDGWALSKEIQAELAAESETAAIRNSNSDSAQLEAAKIWIEGTAAYLDGEFSTASAYFLRSLDTSPGFGLSNLWLRGSLTHMGLSVFARRIESCTATNPSLELLSGTLVVDESNSGTLVPEIERINDIPKPIRFFRTQKSLAIELDARVGVGPVLGLTWNSAQSMMFTHIALLDRDEEGGLLLLSTATSSPLVVRRWTMARGEDSFRESYPEPRVSPRSLVRKDRTSLVEQDARFIELLTSSREAYRFAQSFYRSTVNPSLQKCIQRAALEEAATRHSGDEASAWLWLLLAISEPKGSPLAEEYLRTAARSSRLWIPSYISAAILNGKSSVALPTDLVGHSEIVPASLVNDFKQPFDPLSLRIQISEPEERLGGRLLLSFNGEQSNLSISNLDGSSDAILPPGGCPFLKVGWISNLSLSAITAEEQFTKTKPYFEICRHIQDVAHSELPYVEGLFMLARGFQLQREFHVASELFERIAATQNSSGIVVDEELQANAYFQLAAIELENGDPATALKYAQKALDLCEAGNFHLFSSIRRWKDSTPLRELSVSLLSRIRRTRL